MLFVFVFFRCIFSKVVLCGYVIARMQPSKFSDSGFIDGFSMGFGPFFWVYILFEICPVRIRVVALVLGGNGHFWLASAGWS